MVIRWHDELTMIMIWWWIKTSFLFLLVMRVAVYYELIPCNTLVQHNGATLVQRLIARCPLNDLAAIRMIGDDASILFCPSTLFLPLHWSVGRRPVSEPDSELSARSDIPERSFLRAIKISYEIVLDAAWQVSRGPHTELNIVPQEQF